MNGLCGLSSVGPTAFFLYEYSSLTLQHASNISVSSKRRFSHLLQSAFPVHSTDQPAKRVCPQPRFRIQDSGFRSRTRKEVSSSETKVLTKQVKARVAMRTREGEMMGEGVAAMGRQRISIRVHGWPSQSNKQTLGSLEFRG